MKMSNRFPDTDQNIYINMQGLRIEVWEDFNDDVSNENEWAYGMHNHGITNTFHHSVLQYPYSTNTLTNSNEIQFMSNSEYTHTNDNLNDSDIDVEIEAMNN